MAVYTNDELFDVLRKRTEMKPNWPNSAGISPVKALLSKYNEQGEHGSGKQASLVRA